MKLPFKSIARLVAIYLCVLLVIVLVAGAAANKRTWNYVYDAVESFRIFNPEFYSELERNATREGISVEEYYYRILTKSAGVRTQNLFVMGIDLLKKSFKYLSTQNDYDLGRSIGVSILVLAVSMLAIMLGGYIIGRLAVKRKRLSTVVDNLALFFAGLPSWWVGAVLVSVFAVKFDLLPISGIMTVPPKTGFALVLDVLKHLVLPVGAIFLIHVWEFASVVAHASREELGKPYILAEVAKGIPEGVIFRKHVLRNISILLASFSVQKFMEMTTDYLIVDAFFGLGGLGVLLRNSFVRTVVVPQGVVMRFNYHLFFVVLLSIATIGFLMSLLLELIKGILDPRVS